jgi:GTP-binding protein
MAKKGAKRDRALTQANKPPLIKRAEFITSVFEPARLPEATLPEVAFAGRSNVGKSSLLNRLLGRHNLVKVSSRPGFTQGLNFFLVNDSVYFVDMPGYGFAKAPKSVIKKWQRLAEHYLERRQTLKGVVCILDIRRRPDRLDLGMLEYLRAIGRKAWVVLNKADKVSQPKIKARLNEICPLLPDGCRQPFIISARTGKGVQGLLETIMNELEEGS